MSNEKDWKLKLRYGKEHTPYSHFTAIADGAVVELKEGFDYKKGKAVMSIKTWAIDADESAEMVENIGEQIGFIVIGEVEIYETAPEEPPKDTPYGYDIKFTSYGE